MNTPKQFWWPNAFAKRRKTGGQKNQMSAAELGRKRNGSLCKLKRESSEDDENWMGEVREDVTNVRAVEYGFKHRQWEGRLKRAECVQDVYGGAVFEGESMRMELGEPMYIHRRSRKRFVESVDCDDERINLNFGTHLRDLQTVFQTV